MTRQHAAGYTPAADPYAAHRCVHCPHIVYENDVPGEACRWAGMVSDTPDKGCQCADHRLAPGGRPRTAQEVIHDARVSDPS